MNLSDRINAFVSLGQRLDELTDEEKKTLAEKAGTENGWFTEKSVAKALGGIQYFLSKESLSNWTSHYSLETKSQKIIGVAMAGNIPLVGFHDLLCVLIAGHKLLAKKSSQDSFLIETLSQWLVEIEPRFAKQIEFAERLNPAQAVIATGSDNTARYFEYYFRNIPHIIRKNRSSCAVLMGEEESDLLTTLGVDVFSFFGLGCRNVSKIYVPEEYSFSNLLKSWESYQPIIHHHKYANNYDYQKSIMLINQTPFYDNGFVLLTSQPSLVSPISVLHYEFYKDQTDLKAKLHLQQDKLQCVVSANAWYTGSIPFGKAQTPDVGDYADQVDTLKFLSELK